MGSDNCFKLATSGRKTFEDAKDICEADDAELPSYIAQEDGKKVADFFHTKLLANPEDSHWAWLGVKMIEGISAKQCYSIRITVITQNSLNRQI